MNSSHTTQGQTAWTSDLIEHDNKNVDVGDCGLFSTEYNCRQTAPFCLDHFNCLFFLSLPHSRGGSSMHCFVSHLTCRCSEYQICAFGQVLATAVPVQVRYTYWISKWIREVFHIVCSEIEKSQHQKHLLIKSGHYHMISVQWAVQNQHVSCCENMAIVKSIKAVWNATMRRSTSLWSKHTRSNPNWGHINTSMQLISLPEKENVGKSELKWKEGGGN